MNTKIPFKGNEKRFNDPNDYCTQRRLKETIEFIDPTDMDGLVLDVGEANYVGDKIISHFGSIVYHTLPTDFNIGVLATGTYKTILCLEVIEHVMNPALLMKQLADYLKVGGCVYVSTPVANPHGFLFNETEHFTEYRIDKLKTLFDYCGYKVTKERVFKSIPFFKGMIHGGGLFRTYLRVSSQETQIYRLELK